METKTKTQSPEQKEESEVDDQGRTPFYLAAESGNLEQLKKLLNKENIHRPDNAERSPIYIASKLNHLATVEYLYKHGALEVDPRDPDIKCVSPLTISCFEGNLAVVEFLFDRSANRSLYSMSHYESPLYYASKRGNVEVVQFLISKLSVEDVMQKNYMGVGALAIAASEGHCAIVNLLYTFLNEKGNGCGKDEISRQCVTDIAEEKRRIRGEFRDYMKSSKMMRKRDKSTIIINRDVEDTRHISKLFVDSPILASAALGHLEMVCWLSQHGVDITKASKKGETPMYVASENGHIKIVQFLYKHGGMKDVTRCNNIGQTPLAAAAAKGHFDVVHFLNMHGGDTRQAAEHPVDEKKKDVGAFDLSGLMSGLGINLSGYSSPLHNACKYGHFEIVQYLYQNGAAQDISLLDQDKKSPLFSAIEHGYIKIVKFLIKRVALETFDTVSKIVNTVSKAGRHLTTPFSAACANGHFKMIQFLCNNGATKDINCPNLHGRYPVHKAADGNYFLRDAVYPIGSVNYLKITKLLIKHGAFANQLSKSEETPLSIASSHGNFEFVDWLHKNGGADLETITRPDTKGCTPIFRAVEGGNLKILNLLFDQGAKDVRKPDTGNKITPMLRACEKMYERGSKMKNNIAIVQWLYDHGAAEDIAVPSTKGETPLSVAIAWNQFELVQFLITNGVDINEPSNGNGSSPMSLACTRGSLEMAEWVYNNGGSDDVTKPDADGYTPLHVACKGNDMDMAKFLFTHGAAANIVTASSNGLFPMWCALERGHVRMAQWLYENGAHNEVSRQNASGHFPYYVACENNRLESVKWLHTHGAQNDIVKASLDGYFPLYVACEHNNLKLAQWLFDHGAAADTTRRANGYTIMYAACERNLLGVVKWLKTHGAAEDVLTACTNNEYFPMYVACEKGYVKMAQWLYENGASSDVVRTTGPKADEADPGWFTPMYVAIEKSMFEIVKWLHNKGAALTLPLYCPMSKACGENNMEIVEWAILQDCVAPDTALKWMSNLSHENSVMLFERGITNRDVDYESFVALMTIIRHIDADPYVTRDKNNLKITVNAHIMKLSLGGITRYSIVMSEIGEYLCDIKRMRSLWYYITKHGPNLLSEETETDEDEDVDDD